MASDGKNALDRKYPLDGKNVLVLTTNYGTEQDELTRPVAALRAAGAHVTVAAQKPGDIRTLVADRDEGDRVRPDTTLTRTTADGFDAVVVPGGTVNADRLRTDQDARRLLSAFADTGKPVAAICHGPWILVDSGLAGGRELTSYPSLRPDLENAGATWLDREVVVDTAGGHPLITSRRPKDIDAFTRAIVDTLDTGAIPA
ncbi:type 1 glutamine amidotransferase domain-containing protein [Streptomyces narbonensis]|uniref:Type 1 glutamine amidotransferase domain-containing protein n=1 Tax=Streptomyces narbonensis TaxID=67333 RepID=A0ABV3CL96_9ACTN